MNENEERWTRLRQTAFRLARPRLQDDHDAWEAVNEAQRQFEAAGNRPGNADSLFFTITKRRAIDIARKNLKRVSHEALETDLIRDTQEDESPNSALERVGDCSAANPLCELIHKENLPKLPQEKDKLHQECERLIEKIKSALTPDEWSAVDMCLGQGLAQADVAARLSLSEDRRVTTNAVKMTIRRATKKIARFLPEWRTLRAHLADLNDELEFWSNYEID